MASLKNLLVLGSARFLNVIKGTIEKSQNGAFYGTCTTAAGTKDKVVTLTDATGFELRPGVIVAVKFTYTNTYSNSTSNPITLNVNGTGAKNIYYLQTHSGAGNTGVATNAYGYANRHAFYVYDGTYWVWITHGADNDDNNHMPTCTTGAGTAAKTAACAYYYLLADSYIPIVIQNTNSAASALTLNINGQGAKPIYINGSASSSSNHTLPRGTYVVYYDGTNYYFRTDGKLPADISGDSATTNQHTLGHDEDENVVVAWDGGEVITPPSGTALAISQGGTGATTAAAARTNLGLGSAATYNVVSSVNNDSNLVTGAAIKSYYEAVGIPSAISTTSAATAAKVATCSSFKLLANSYIQVIIANANTASSALTLNINSTGAKPIIINGAASSSSNKTLPAGSYFVFYNGTNYYFRTDGKITGDITGNAATVDGKSVRNSTTTGSIGWTSAAASTKLLTQNDITYWNGRYDSNSSNLMYCKKGAFGNAATYDVVNNGTTSAEGYVLDARFAKDLIDELSDASTLANGYFVLKNGLKVIFGTKTFTTGTTAANSNYHVTWTITLPIKFDSVGYQFYQPYSGNTSRRLFVRGGSATIPANTTSVTGIAMSDVASYSGSFSYLFIGY